MTRIRHRARHATAAYHGHRSDSPRDPSGVPRSRSLARVLRTAALQGFATAQRRIYNRSRSPPTVAGRHTAPRRPDVNRSQTRLRWGSAACAGSSPPGPPAFGDRHPPARGHAPQRTRCGARRRFRADPAPRARDARRPARAPSPPALARADAARLRRRGQWPPAPGPSDGDRDLPRADPRARRQRARTRRTSRQPTAGQRGRNRDRPAAGDRRNREPALRLWRPEAARTARARGDREDGPRRGGV